jgi:hypothetical protein
MKTAKSFLSMNRQRLLGASLSVALLSAACGENAEPDDDDVTEPDASAKDAQGGPPRDDAGSPPADTGSPNTNPDGAGAKVDAGPGGGSAESLFKGPPECEEGTISIVRVEGTIDGKPISYEKKGVSSVFGPESLSTKDDLSVTPPLSWIVLGWEEPMLTVPPGTVLTANRGWLNFSRPEAGEQGNYCTVSARLGPAPSSQQPGTGSRVFFEVSSVKVRDGDAPGAPCTGPELPAKIKGCLYRTVR